VQRVFPYLSFNIVSNDSIVDVKTPELSCLNRITKISIILSAEQFRHPCLGLINS